MYDDYVRLITEDRTKQDFLLAVFSSRVVILFEVLRFTFE